jgi:hypothetical protein
VQRARVVALEEVETDEPARSPPAIRKAGRVIPKISKMYFPAVGKTATMTNASTTPWSATWRFVFSFISWVSPRKMGVFAM